MKNKKMIFKSEVGMCLNNRHIMLKRKNEAWDAYSKAQAAYERAVDAHEKAEATLRKWENEQKIQT